LKVDPVNPDPDLIRRAAAVIRAGGLVAFPTETVYGLGANALDPAAVARIFEAKGRPATNPVIVHIGEIMGNAAAADGYEVFAVAARWPAAAARLAARFWPGPLTLVVPKSDAVPGAVTAGGATVAVRCPNHPVARALIRAAGVPIAAPSANRSTELSPTRAEHVRQSLNGRIDFLLDGGPCTAGIESTVVDVTGAFPRVLRPGPITVPMLEEACGRVEFGATGEGVARSPGQMAKHYSPRTPVALADGAAHAARLQSRGRAGGSRVVALGFDVTRELETTYRRMPGTPEAYAADLYAVLHETDRAGWDLIVVEMPPDEPAWAAVRDRLLRAAAE
jgi:L-threonylcarbamoyladenylate synthase